MGLSHGIQVDEVHVFTSEEILEFLDHAFRRALALVQNGLKRIDAVQMACLPASSKEVLSPASSAPC